MIPMVTGKIDLTVGYGIVLWHILAISLQTWYGVPWPVAVDRRPPARRGRRLPQRPAGRGGADRQLHRHARHRHRALCARAVAHRRPPGRRRAARRLLRAQRAPCVLGLPITGFYVLALALVLWFVLEYLPIGRYLYAIGANPKAAALNGIPVRTLHHRRLRHLRHADRRRRRAARRQAPHRPGQRRARIPAAGAGRRLPRLDHDQARPRQRLGHAGRRHHPRHRHLRHPAVRRLVLGRADVQRRDAARRHRHRRLRPAQAQRRAAAGSAKAAETHQEFIKREETNEHAKHDTAGRSAPRRRWPASAPAASPTPRTRWPTPRRASPAATAKAGTWDGPTTGPKAATGKTIIYVAGDLRNGGTEGVSRGVEEAAKAIGWELRVLDGHGDISARTAAMSQAIALKPERHHRRRLRRHRAERRARAGQGGRIPFVGWHATIEPGPGRPRPACSPTSTPASPTWRQTAADLAIVDSDGKAGVVIFGDSNYEMAIGKAAHDGGRHREGLPGLHGARASRTRR